MMKVMIRSLFWVLFLLGGTAYSTEGFHDYEKDNMPCSSAPPYHLSIYADTENYYIDVNITNSFSSDVWIPKEHIGLQTGNRDSELIVFTGIFYFPYVISHDFMPKTEKLEKGKKYLTTYEIDKRRIDNFLKETFGSANRFTFRIKVSFIEFIEGTYMIRPEDIDNYKKNTCVIELTTNQRLPILIKDDWDDEGDDP